MIPRSQVFDLPDPVLEISGIATFKFFKFFKFFIFFKFFKLLLQFSADSTALLLLGGAKVLYCLHMISESLVNYSTFLVRNCKSAVLYCFFAVWGSKSAVLYAKS